MLKIMPDVCGYCGEDFTEGEERVEDEGYSYHQDCWEIQLEDNGFDENS